MGIIIEGVVATPTTAREIYIQAYDAADSLLGVASTYLNPGGSFRAYVEAHNAGKLGIRYTCEGGAMHYDQVDCELGKWTWRQSSAGIVIEGVLQGTAAKQIHIQAFDSNDKFLGVTSTYLNPGGSFRGYIENQTEPKTLHVRIACE